MTTLAEFKENHTLHLLDDILNNSWDMGGIAIRKGTVGTVIEEIGDRVRIQLDDGRIANVEKESVNLVEILEV